MKQSLGRAGVVLAGAIAAAMATTMATVAPARAAILSTQTVDYAIQLLVTESVTGTGAPRLTFTASQSLAFDRIDPTQSLTAITAIFTARMPDYVFAVSQLGAGQGNSIVFGPLVNEVTASVAPGGTPLTLGALTFGFTGPSLEFVVCTSDLCFDQNGGSRAEESATLSFDAAALLAFFTGSDQAKVDIEVEQIFDLSYSTGTNPGPSFGYALNFQFAGSLTLVFEGEEPEEPGPNDPAAVPAPAGAALLAAGLALVALRRRQR